MNYLLALFYITNTDMWFDYCVYLYAYFQDSNSKLATFWWSLRYLMDDNVWDYNDWLDYAKYKSLIT